MSKNNKFSSTESESTILSSPPRLQSTSPSSTTPANLPDLPPTALSAPSSNTSLSMHSTDQRLSNSELQLQSNNNPLTADNSTNANPSSIPKVIGGHTRVPSYYDPNGIPKPNPGGRKRSFVAHLPSANNSQSVLNSYYASHAVNHNLSASTATNTTNTTNTSGGTAYETASSSSNSAIAVTPTSSSSAKNSSLSLPIYSQNHMRKPSGEQNLVTSSRNKNGGSTLDSVTRSSASASASASANSSNSNHNSHIRHQSHGDNTYQYNYNQASNASNEDSPHNSPLNSYHSTPIGSLAGTPLVTPHSTPKGTPYNTGDRAQFAAAKDANTTNSTGSGRSSNNQNKKSATNIVYGAKYNTGVSSDSTSSTLSTASNSSYNSLPHHAHKPSGSYNSNTFPGIGHGAQQTGQQSQLQQSTDYDNNTMSTVSNAPQTPQGHIMSSKTQLHHHGVSYNNLNMSQLSPLLVSPPMMNSTSLAQQYQLQHSQPSPYIKYLPQIFVSPALLPAAVTISATNPHYPYCTGYVVGSSSSSGLSNQSQISSASSQGSTPGGVVQHGHNINPHVGNIPHSSNHNSKNDSINPLSSNTVSITKSPVLYSDIVGGVIVPPGSYIPSTYPFPSSTTLEGFHSTMYMPHTTGISLDDEDPLVYCPLPSYYSLNPVKSAFVMKQGHTFRLWRKRLLALEGRYLFYYAEETDLQPRGVICLEGCIVREEIAIGKERKTHCFSLHAKKSWNTLGRKRYDDRIYYFTLNSFVETSAWMALLDSCSTDLPRYSADPLFD